MDGTLGSRTIASIRRDVEAERLEFETVLNDLFVRHSNTRKLFCFVCDKYFEGAPADIKEYTIAVDALGRSPDFDSRVDSIVRVEAHRLRSKLESYYKDVATRHVIQISIPAGCYIPQFIHRPAETANLPAGLGSAQDIDPPSLIEQIIEEPVPSNATQLRPGGFDETVRQNGRYPWRLQFLLPVGVAAVVILMAAVGAHFWRKTILGSIPGKESAFEAALITRPSSNNSDGIRILAGTQFPGELDWGGDIWVADRYFSGGEAANSSQTSFEFTTTPSLYTHRRRGAFSYTIPLRKGTYELKLHFADAYFGPGNPDQGGESSRLFDVRANGETLLHEFDVISDAGGPNTADVRVFADIKPSDDGALHLDFIPNRNVPFINGIEILPTLSTKMLPIRIYAGPINFKDDDGIVWSSDRYFRGGVHYHALTNQAAPGDSDVRFGNFVYQIPVVAGESYAAALRFCPIQLPVGQNAPTNVFSVSLNAHPLVDDFQLPADGSQTGCIVKVFHNLKSNAQGKLTFAFVPTSGYASVTSIAIDQE